MGQVLRQVVTNSVERERAPVDATLVVSARARFVSQEGGGEGGQFVRSGGTPELVVGRFEQEGLLPGEFLGGGVESRSSGGRRCRGREHIGRIGTYQLQDDQGTDRCVNKILVERR